MSLASFIRAMPKVELHVHLEGSVRPETLISLARRHDISLPAKSVEELHDWYTFTNFDHFIEVYSLLSHCLRTPDDLELITREFLASQAAQHVLYSEVTYTAYSIYKYSGIRFDDQLAAINRARAWGERELGTRMAMIIDIPRLISPEEGLLVADWAISGMEVGICALGLGGPEVGNPPEKFAAAFERAAQAGLPAVPHAGETMGPESIWGALRHLHARRIGHGVRCLEDPALVGELRDRQIPLEVCPTSNVCLKVVPDWQSHPLPRLLDAGLVVTLNSDDPQMFNTTLTEEYLRAAEIFHLDADQVENMVLTALNSSLLAGDERAVLEEKIMREFNRLRAGFLEEE
jgi:adenosine deaminase